MAPSTINRLCRCLCAALEQAAQHDKRIQNRDAWEIGLAGLPNAQEVRNVIIADDKVRELIAAAYRLDHQFGLLTDTLAITGARPSQAVRLRVEDLHNHPLRPKLMMPKSAKGGGRNRSQKKTERYSVPITVQLAARLKAAATRPCRRCAAAGAKRRQALGPQSRSTLSSPRRRGRHRHRSRSRSGDNVCLATFQHRQHVAAKHSDPGGCELAQHHRQRCSKSIIAGSSPSIHRRHHARRTFVGTCASR